MLKIVQKGFNKYQNIQRDEFTVVYDDICLIEASNDVLVAQKDNRKIILDGYIEPILDHQKYKDKYSTAKDILLYLLDLQNLTQLEINKLFGGRFIIVYVYEKKCSIFLDSFSRKDLYYVNQADKICLATDLRLLNANKYISEKYNQCALAHMLTYYGNRPAKNETIYESISRVGVGESVKITTSGFKIELSEFISNKTREYRSTDHDIYFKIFLNTIEEYGSSDKNLIYLSSGWDSTSILAGLVHIFGADKVEGITGRMLYSDRSGVCNAIEIEKVKKFAEYYSIKCNFVDFDYASKGEQIFESALPSLKKHGYYNVTACNHYLLSEAAANFSDAVVFAGEISDGAHNFGFSQYTTMFHPSSFGFREYADKMASYLVGPTFLNRLIEGSYNEDPVYQLLTDGKYIKETLGPDRASIIKQFFISFFLRNGRRPLWSGENISILSKEGVREYTDFHQNNYLSNIENIDSSELYSWYLHLYNSFHWQSSTVAPIQSMLEERGIKSCLPFWSKPMQVFLSAMPEDWGRGLDLNSTKYPLKYMLQNMIDYPFEFQHGYHSYTYDIDPSFNHMEELFIYSNIKPMMQKSLSDMPYKQILSPKMFNFKYIDNIVEKYLNDEVLSLSALIDLVPIAMMSYVGWQE